MTTPELGRIEEVELREVWPREDENFTPWLAENLDVLGDALGLQLELTGTEVPTGQYFLDILAEEAEGGNVAIENQLEPTDHDHLGKLVTYAAGHETEYVIWVAPQFTAEHRAAIDWLNRLAPDKVWFYGVEVRAIKVDDSLPAPEFRVVADPNDQPGSDVEARQYRDFFRPLVGELSDAEFTRLNRIYGQHYQTFASGIEISGGKNVGYGVSIGDVVNEVSKASVYLWIKSGNSGISESDQHIFAALLEELEPIEAEIATGLVWDDRQLWGFPNVSLYKDCSIYDPPENLEEIRAWMFENLLKFKEVFNPRLETILAEEEA